MTRRRIILNLITLVALLLAPGTIDAAGPQRGREPGKKPAGKHAKLDTVLNDALEAGDRGTKQVIIRTKKSAHRHVRDALELTGTKVKGEHPSIDGVTALVAGDVLEILASSSVIELVSIDAIVTASGGPGKKKRGKKSSPMTSPDATTAPAEQTENLLRATLGLPVDDLRGAGIGVAIIDSGIHPSADFNGRITAFYDFTRGGVRQADPYDDYGHGTHVAGLIGSAGQLSNGQYQGVAPAVRLVGLKVLNTQGQGRTSNVIEAIEFAVEYRLALGIDIINLSLGHPIDEPAATDPLVQAVEAAVRAGIIVVTSAGNNGTNPETGEVGYAGINSPGNAPSAITVGAVKTQDTVTRSDDRVADYSSRGPTWYDGFAKLDLVAPGHALVSKAADENSTIFEKYPSLRVTLGGENFLKLSGASMATAVTSGVAALVFEANRTAHTVLATTCVTADDVIGWNLSHYCAPAAAPPLTPNAVKMILQYTALWAQDDLGVDYHWFTQGAGGVNAAGAIALATVIDTAVPVGDPWLVAPFEPSTAIAGET